MPPGMPLSRKLFRRSRDAPIRATRLRWGPHWALAASQRTTSTVGAIYVEVNQLYRCREVTFDSSPGRLRRLLDLQRHADRSHSPGHVVAHDEAHRVPTRGNLDGAVVDDSLHLHCLSLVGVQFALHFLYIVSSDSSSGC